MARPGLQRNRKWPRLVRALGGEALARGSLELLWDVAYENGEEYLGDSDDVELAAKWQGPAGVLTKALLDAGGPGEPGFIEEHPEKPGRYIIHDLWDHAPDYVRKRRVREGERQTKGAELAAMSPKPRRSSSSDRSLTGQSPPDGGHRPDDGGQAADVDRCPAPFGRTRAPAPTQEAAAARGRARTRDDQLGMAEEATCSPGPEEDTGPVKSDAVQANTATPGGSASAVQDGGEAAPAGMPGETRGAAGPGHLHVLPAPDEAPAPKRFAVEDVSALGPVVAEWVGRLERELGRGLAAATPEVRNELQHLLERPGYGGPDRALSWVITTLDGRRRAGGPAPGSVAYVATMLRSMPPLEAGAMERARETCPEWGRLLDAAMSLPPGNAPTEHQLADVLLPLRATFLRGELHLEAADEGRKRFVEEVFGGGLRRLAIETLGPHVLVHVRGPEVEARRA